MYKHLKMNNFKNYKNIQKLKELFHFDIRTICPEYSILLF